MVDIAKYTYIWVWSVAFGKIKTFEFRECDEVIRKHISRANIILLQVESVSFTILIMIAFCTLLAPGYAFSTYWYE